MDYASPPGSKAEGHHVIRDDPIKADNELDDAMTFGLCWCGRARCPLNRWNGDTLIQVTGTCWAGHATSPPPSQE